MRKSAAILALVVGTAALVWWGARGSRPAPIGVVVITLDTTRADRLSPYGNMDISLPGLERIAREGVVFDEASTVAPMTLPAHTSLFTGLLPSSHGVRDNADEPLADSRTTLAEILASEGYRTGAFVSSVVLEPGRGLRQGFNEYESVDLKGEGPEAMQRRADAVIDSAIRWLDSIGSDRFFLWTHLYDAHRPYDPPEPYRSKYGHDLYLGEIAFADSQVERLLKALDQRRLLDRVVLVIAGDHGESLGDHGERDHGIFVYEEVIRVPLMIRASALRARRVGEVVRLTDVLPTVLQLLGLPLPQVDGQSLLNLIAGKPGDSERELEAYSESLYPERLGWSPLYALRQGRFKLIKAPRPELYDLDRDPFETVNIYADRPAAAAAMTARLDALARSDDQAAHDGGQSNVSREVQERLAALGYVSLPVARDASDRTARPDPKDCIGTRRRLANEPVNPLCSAGLRLGR
jgi:arylsulfatase A-like enzyme